MFTRLADQPRVNPEVAAAAAERAASLEQFVKDMNAEGARFRAALNLPPAAPAAAAAAPVANVLAAQQGAAPPENVNQLASAGAAAAVDPTAALRAKRDQLIALGTPRALQAAKSLDADIALMAKRITASPGSVIYDSSGRVVATVPEAPPKPSNIADLEREIADIKKTGATDSDPRIVARLSSIAQISGQSDPLIRQYQFAVQRQGFKGTLLDYKRQIAEAGRAPVQPVAPTVTTVEDPTNPGKFLQVDARTYRGGGAGSPGVIGSARPSATAEKAANQQAQLRRDLDFAISELGDITKDGGLIDQSTGSGAGRLVDVGARFVGQAMPGDIAIGKIAPVADLALKMVPRFEGPQSDKDTASYKEAAGQLADATLPREVRKQAGKTVLRLMTERKNQFRSRDMEAEGAGPAAGGVDANNPLLK